MAIFLSSRYGRSKITAHTIARTYFVYFRMPAWLLVGTCGRTKFCRMRESCSSCDRQQPTCNVDEAASSVKCPSICKSAKIDGEMRFFRWWLLRQLYFHRRSEVSRLIFWTFSSERCQNTCKIGVETSENDIGSEKEAKFCRIAGLLKLFYCIRRVRGNLKMSWSEFTFYILHCVHKKEPFHNL